MGITGNSGRVDAYGTTTQAYVYTGNGLTLKWSKTLLFTQYTVLPMVARIWG